MSIGYMPLKATQCCRGGWFHRCRCIARCVRHPTACRREAGKRVPPRPVSGRWSTAQS